MKKRISLGVITLMLLMSVCNICFSQQIEGSVSIVQDQQNNGLVSYPSDTKSPRTTLESFLYLTQCYYDFIKTDGFTSENIEELISISNQIVKLFDLRNVAPSFREDVAMEAAVFLREALDRVDLPPMKDVPDEEKMSKAIHDGKVPFYRIPGTMIDIERISEGTYAGHY